MSSPLILVTNDDGIDAEGIDALTRAVQPLGEVWVVAPSQQQSAVSNAISLRDPLRVRRRGERRVAVSGTPTDCVYVAINHLLERRPALCVSGINHGANLADDVKYSGTVAAAIEATLNDVPSIAFSLASYEPEFAASLVHVRELAAQVLARPMPRATLLNVNFPADVTEESPRYLTKLGRRNYGRVVVEKRDPRDQPYFWLGGADLGFDDIPGSDCNAVARGHISVTPIDLDLTHYRFKKEMARWPGFSTPAGGDISGSKSERG